MNRFLLIGCVPVELCRVRGKRDPTGFSDWMKSSVLWRPPIGHIELCRPPIGRSVDFSHLIGIKQTAHGIGLLSNTNRKHDGVMSRQCSTCLKVGVRDTRLQCAIGRCFANCPEVYRSVHEPIPLQKARPQGSLRKGILSGMSPI